MSIPFNFALRRRIAGSNIIAWIKYFGTGQWGNGTSKTITKSLQIDKVIQFHFVNSAANANMRYELYNGSVSASDRVLQLDGKCKDTTIVTPSQVTHIVVTNRSGSTLELAAYYRVF